jgi:hypothetical protein
VALGGRKAVRPGGTIAPPRKIYDVLPRYPELPKNTTISRGIWLGEILIDTSGSVARIWTLREPELTPQFPAFAKAITDAMSRWRFQPVRIADEPTPVCISVSVNIDVR